MEETSVYQPEGNYFDKYNSKNFIIKKMMSGFFASYNDLLNKVRDEINTVMEAGCGEAEVTEFLHDNLNKEIFAFDISDRVISEAKDRLKNKKINFWVDNIYNISKNEKYDLVVCSEVLEHMDHPEKALSEVKRCSGKYILCSVPRERLWCCLNMCRGKYLKDFGNTPGHVQHWSKKAFLRFLENNGLEIVDVKSPLPWTVVLAKIK